MVRTAREGRHTTLLRIFASIDNIHSQANITCDGYDDRDRRDNGTADEDDSIVTVLLSAPSPTAES